MTPSAPGTASSPYRRRLEQLAAHQKPRRGVSVYSVHVNRPLGRRVAAAADLAGLRPATVTLLSAAVSLGAVVLLVAAPITVPVGLAVGLLLVAGYVLDSADGQLARLQGSTSASGELLDHLVDVAVKLLLHLAVLVAWWQAGVRLPWLALPLAFQVVAVVLFFGVTLMGKLYVRPASEHATGGVRSWLLLPVDHGTLCAAFLLWGVQPVFRVVYLALAVGTLLALVWLTRQWTRELG